MVITFPGLFFNYDKLSTMNRKQTNKSLAEMETFSIDFEKLSKIRGGDDDTGGHDLFADEADLNYDDGKKPPTRPRPPQPPQL